MSENLGNIIEAADHALRDADASVTFTSPSRDHAPTYLVYHNGFHAADITKQIEALQPHPRRRSGRVNLLTVDSFAEYVVAMREEDRTVIFADKNAQTVTAVLNYHDPVNVPLPDMDGNREPEMPHRDPRPQWGDHRAVFAFPRSRQWKAWAAVHKKELSQVALAEFIEENIRDVRHETLDELPPQLKLLVTSLGLHLGSPQRLLETARGFQVKADEVVRSAVNTSTGEMQIVFEEKHGGLPGEMRVPTAFTIGIPVYHGSAAFHLLCRLRYRKRDGGLKWMIDIQDIEGAQEDAFNAELSEISTKTGVALLEGEAPSPATVS